MGAARRIAVLRLFDPDAQYHNTPFAVQRGHAQLAEYWQRVKLQEDVLLTYEVLASTPGAGIAHWHVSYQVASEELFQIWARSTGTSLVARKPGRPAAAHGPRRHAEGRVQRRICAAIARSGGTACRSRREALRRRGGVERRAWLLQEDQWADHPSCRDGRRGRCACGATVKHRSRIARDPTQPNLRQVHLIHGELFDELSRQGHDVQPGQMGENIATRGLQLLALPAGTMLHVGASAVLRLTGLRNPCTQLDQFRPGLMSALLGRGTAGERFAVGRMDGVVVGGRTRRHAMAASSRLTRRSRPCERCRLKIPRGVKLVVVQAREQRNGYGGKTIEVRLPGR